MIKKSNRLLYREENNPQFNSSLIVLLDNVRSMHNVGSVFRSADAFAIDKIILSGFTPKPPHRDIEKTALGATQTVDWAHVNSPEQSILHLKNEGYTILAIEQVFGSFLLSNYAPKTEGKYVLIFGNEVDGVSQESLNLVDGCVEIPQIGTKHSLNISVSAGLVLWDFSFKMARIHSPKSK